MDIEIVEEILKGNLDAFSQIVDKYEKMIYNLAYRIFNNTSDAEDMTQEIFIKIYKNIYKCEGKQSIKTWVYTIAYNTCIDEVRKRKGKNNISLDIEIEGEENSFSLDVPSDEPTPESALLQKEGFLEIEQAINSLNEINKSLVFLRDIKGFSYNEISEIMGINIGTVKSRLNRARNTLKNMLKF
ncbi:sigma-70 family RNA polymerase sigma factor [uncultured Tyzzerella sp.]|uniref:RNA polymerase sigma factor n=1 Tax=uncultured Tyzzerella sp. TaxID=2321398 RepID=UPI002942911B|nr:sigma-70 family RNA polymerase sigma factor [uncultured Tyzzerella sp.]